MRGTFGLSLQQHLMAGAAIVAVASASPAEAQVRNFDVPAQPAAQGIPAFARQAGVQIIASGNAVRDRRTNAVHGAYSVEEGLRILLNGTRLAAGPPGQTGIITIVASAEGNAGAAGEAASSLGEGAGATAQDEGARQQAIVVTGTHLRNADPLSPVLVLNRSDIQRSGASRLDQFLEMTPQNSKGLGQETHALSSGAGLITNDGHSRAFASGVDLRGLGSGATLVLINGHRLAGTTDGGAVDISSIPLNLLSRVEIELDGASAVYGSDAVAGVLNVITRNNFDGLEVTGVYGGVSNGGKQDSDFSALLGKTWQGGSVMIAADQSHRDPLSNRDRPFAASLGPDVDLIPTQNTTSLFGSARQNLGSRASFSLDVLASRRRYKALSDGPFVGLALAGKVDSLSASAEIRYELTPSIELLAPVTFSVNRETDLTEIFRPIVSSSSQKPFDRIWTFEPSLRGEIAGLPAGPVRLAIGGQLKAERFASQAPTIEKSRESEAAFIEALIPIISGLNETAWANQLDLSLAGRYDHYNDFGDTWNPKIALSWKPRRQLTLEGGYSTSFRAPSLFQLYYTGSAALAALNFTDPSSPTGTTFGIAQLGNNPDLRPETSRSMNLRASYVGGPRDNFRFSVNYFDIHYRNRILALATAIPSYTAFLQFESALAGFIVRNPSAAQIDVLLSSGIPLRNFTKTPVNDSTVKAIGDLRFHNASQVTQRGFDFDTADRWHLGAATTEVRLDGQYLLDDLEKLTPTGPAIQRAGEVYYPARLHLNASVDLGVSPVTLTGTLRYVSSSTDPVDFGCIAPAPSCRISPFTTVDLVGAYESGETTHGVLRGVRISVSALNIFNRRPPHVNLLSATIGGGFDPVNASALGRYLSVSVTKRL